MVNKTYVQAQRITYFQQLFETNRKLFETKKYASIIENKPSGSRKVKALFPLKDHPEYGETVLRLTEKFDDFGNIVEYHYGWELSQRKKKQGKSIRHIMAFGNEDHPDPPAWVETNPYHHHHILGQPGKRKETNVQDLQTAIGIFTDYIEGRLVYDKDHSF